MIGLHWMATGMELFVVLDAFVTVTLKLLAPLTLDVTTWLSNDALFSYLPLRTPSVRTNIHIINHGMVSHPNVYAKGMMYPRCGSMSS